MSDDLKKSEQGGCGQALSGERVSQTGSHRIGNRPEAGPHCQSSKNKRSKEQNGRKAKQGWGWMGKDGTDGEEPQRSSQ